MSKPEQLLADSDFAMVARLVKLSSGLQKAVHSFVIGVPSLDSLLRSPEGIGEGPTIPATSSQDTIAPSSGAENTARYQTLLDRLREAGVISNAADSKTRIEEISRKGTILFVSKDDMAALEGYYAKHIDVWERDHCPPHVLSSTEHRAKMTERGAEEGALRERADRERQRALSRRSGLPRASELDDPRLPPR